MAALGLTYALDQNLAHPLLALLRNARMEPLGRVTSLEELGFAPNAKDVDWLLELGRWGSHCVISRDGKILRLTVERQAWRASGVSLLVLDKRWGQLPLSELARRLLYWWPYMVQHAEAGQQGEAWTVPSEVPNPGSRTLRRVTG